MQSDIYPIYFYLYGLSIWNPHGIEVDSLVFHEILFVCAANTKTITNGRERRRLSALAGIVHLVAGKPAVVSWTSHLTISY